MPVHGFASDCGRICLNSLRLFTNTAQTIWRPWNPPDLRTFPNFFLCPIHSLGLEKFWKCYNQSFPINLISQTLEKLQFSYVQIINVPKLPHRWRRRASGFSGADLGVRPGGKGSGNLAWGELRKEKQRHGWT